MVLRLRHGDRERAVGIGVQGDVYRVRLGERSHEVRVRSRTGDRLDLELDGRPVRAYVCRDRDRLHVHVCGASWSLERVMSAALARRAHDAHGDTLEAPMPGQVRAVRVAPGQAVQAGETLVVLEAMKMELRIRAPHDGKVRRVGCRVGDVVERGQVLVQVDPVAEAPPPDGAREPAAEGASVDG